jgi:hypothetical protein
MYGNAFPEFGFSKSEVYVKQITDYLARKGYVTFVRKSKSADGDFVFGAHAKQIITTGGGYSNLLAEVQNRIHKTKSSDAKLSSHVESQTTNVSGL